MTAAEANDHDDKLMMTTNISMVVVICIICLIIFICSMVGNVLVVYSVLRHMSKQTAINVFMLNLAVANILSGIFVLPITPVLLIANKWVFGWFMCYFWPIVYYSTYYASMFTLVAIAEYRYLTIVRQLRYKNKIRKVILTVVMIWFISIATSLPPGMYSITKAFTDGNINDDNVVTCFVDWPFMNSPSIYYITTFIVLLMIPLCVCAFFYNELSIKISRMSIKCSKQMADERRTNRLLLAMTSVFCFLSMPYHIVELFVVADIEIFARNRLAIVLRVLYIMALSATCFTPLFYVWLNKITVKQLCLIGQCFSQQSNESINKHGFKTIAPTKKTLTNADRTDDVTHNAHCDAVILDLFQPD